MGSAPATGERKPITVLFADVVGSTSLAETMDPEDWTELVNEAFERLTEAVHRYEGTVAQFTGDGLLAFFGAPVAHEDDPERAVRAGLDMIGSVDGMELRVGINTGPVVVGPVGSEYTAVGDAVNVAARMQAAARPGTVLVTNDTYRLVAGRFDAVDRGAVEVKGKSEPVPAYEVVGGTARPARARGIPGLASPLVGRADELGRLVATLEAVSAGRGRVAVVTGEPGIGKSRLLAEFRARAADATWLEGGALSYGRNLPYHLVADLVRPLLPRARDLLGARADEAYPFLAHVLGLDDARAASLPDRLDPEALRRGYLDAFRALVRGAATAPLVLACEDLHWADPSSVEALDDLLRITDEAPVLVLCTLRPDRDTPGWRLVADARELYGEALTEIPLGALSGDSSRELVANLLAIESLPEAVRETILERADGNPFFVEEVVRMLIGRGAIVRRGETWVATEDAVAVEIPETVHGLLLARIDRLPGDARRALRVAAVIGRRVPGDVLAAVAGEIPLGPATRALEAAGLVELAVAEPAVEYVFRHVLVQEAAYESLLKRERRDLHRAVAEALAQLRRGDELDGVLGYHFERAGETELALEHLLRAARRALSRFANREAYDLFGRAEALVEPGDARRIEIGIGLVQAGYLFVPWGEEMELLESLLPEAEAIDAPRLQAELHLWIARVRRGQGQHPDSTPELRRSLERVEELAEQLGEDRLRGLPLAFRASSKFDGGEFRAAARLFERAVPLLEQPGDLGTAAYYAGVLALAYARLGEFARADEWLRRASELADRSGDANARLDADIIGGLIEAERGNLAAGIELARKGAELAEQIGNTYCAVVGNFAIGEQQLRQGQPALAIPALERSTELAKYCDIAPIENLSRAWLSAARAELGDLDAALAGFETALANARSLGDRLGEAEILHRRALALAMRPGGEWEEAAAEFEESLRLFEELETRPYLARTLVDYGLGLERAGRVEEGRERLERAAELFAEMGIGDSVPSP